MVDPAQFPPPHFAAHPPPTSGTATASLVLGTLSLVACLGLLTGIPAMVLGRRAAREIEASGGALGGEGFARTGFVTGLVGTVLSVLALAVLAALVLVVVGSLETLVEGPCVDVRIEPSDRLC